MERRIAAIFAADMVGYSRLMEADEVGTLARQKRHRAELIDPKIDAHGGTTIKLTGDGMIAEFPSVVEAVQCAVSIQMEMEAREDDEPEDRRIRYRIAVNLGDVIFDDGDVYGDGVNIAARLEALAEPGGVIVSGTAYDHLKSNVDVGYEDLGEQRVKNIATPVRAYSVLLEPGKAKRTVFRHGPFWRLLADVRRSRSAAAVAVLVGIVIGVLIATEPWVPRVQAASEEVMTYPLPSKPSLAILPFQTQSVDPEMDHLARGIADAVITTLAMTEGLFVSARDSSFKFTDDSTLAKEVAEQLGVRHVLTGNFYKSGDEVRIAAQLVDALRGRQIWAGSFDRALEDAFKLQDDIALKLVEEMQIELTLGEQSRLYRERAPDGLTYQMMIKASELFKQSTPEGNAESVQILERIIETHPSYAGAHIQLGWCLQQYAFRDWGRDKAAAFSDAERIAHKAIDLSSKDSVEAASAHSLLAWLWVFQGKQEEAIKSARHSVALFPQIADNSRILAIVLVIAGEGSEALQRLDHAERLSPLTFEFDLWARAEAYRQLGEFEKMIPISKQISDVHWWEFPRLVYAYVKMGNMELAKNYLEQMLGPNSSEEKKRELTAMFASGIRPLPDDMFLDYVNTLKLAGLPDVEWPVQ